ncbi:flavin reductase family protein [Robbsia sp. Bb-Pol-6]|uniref:Flavin reductase family protein n=1 Tax=Robbsia betulipollinis TaxID=2981849 RepID=A0ABT3ZM85_9BURK|nr:flavin reductase family protein [Robbsia betulipollinis]MCY0387666.1 flavin reductase family protein [Robbsia betulipollinis]
MREAAGREAALPDFDAAVFRQTLAQFATGVTVITTRATNGELLGITASSFNSVSLAPPLILWSLARTASSMPVFRDNAHYVVNVLAAEQVDLCRHFATVKTERFAGIAHRVGTRGLPILDGALAWFECHNRSRYDEGDHTIFVGEVERCGMQPDPATGRPLVFQDGRFHTTGPLAE